MFPCTSRNVSDNFCTCILVLYMCTMHALLHAPVDDVITLCHLLVHAELLAAEARAHVAGAQVVDAG